MVCELHWRKKICGTRSTFLHSCTKCLYCVWFWWKFVPLSHYCCPLPSVYVSKPRHAGQMWSPTAFYVTSPRVSNLLCKISISLHFHRPFLLRPSGTGTSLQGEKFHQKVGQFRFQNDSYAPQNRKYHVELAYWLLMVLGHHNDMRKCDVLCMFCWSWTGYFKINYN